MNERHVVEELWNVYLAGHVGLWPGGSISHPSVRELVRRGWIRRRQTNGRYVLTPLGIRRIEHGPQAVGT